MGIVSPNQADTTMAMDTSGTTATTTKSGSSAGAAASNNRASLTDRRTFAKSLYQITKEDLGKLLVEVEQKYPAALKRNAAEDEIELNVDVIPAALLTELTQFINGAKKRKTSASGSKKAKTSKA